jgi:hypothetical protein
MKFFCAILIALLYTMPLRSQEIQRMITDFRGVATNGKTVVAYGDYGIITTTRDYGKTWSQITLGDKHSIKRILNIENDFIGVTDYTLMKSTDEGKTWLKAPELFDKPQILDATLSGNILYVLTPQGIWTADANMQMSSKPLTQLEPQLKYKEITSDNENIYVLADTVLIRYSLASKSSSTSIITATLAPNMFNRFVSNLKIAEGMLYGMLNNINGQGISQFLIQSTDKGNTWKEVTPDLLYGNTYKIEDGEIYFLRTHTGLSYVPKFYIVDSTHYDADQSYFTIINDKDSLERAITFSSYEDNRFTGLVSINKDTMIAVGKNNLIYISYNGGKSWKLRSFFSADQSIDEESSCFIDENRGYIVANKIIFTTADGGITWLPQKRMSKTPNTNNSGFIYHFDNKGRGYVRYGVQNSKDTNIIMTNDYGDSYSMYDIDPFYREYFTPTSQKGVAIEDVILFATKQIFTSLPYSHIIRFNDQFNFIDSVRIDVKNIENIIAAPDGKLYILGMKAAGQNKADSMGNSGTYSYSYLMLQSSDKGKTWDSIVVNLPIQQELVYSDYYKYYMFHDRLYGSYAIVQGDYILYPAISGTIYRFNFKTTAFDSITAAPGRLNRAQNSIFRLGSKLYAVSEANTVVYHTDWNNFSMAELTWDSLAIDNLFAGWQNYDPSNPKNYKDGILSVQMFNDSTGIMLLGYTRPGGFGENFKINVVKLLLRTSATGIYETATNERTYLWNSPPYPLPGKNIIASRIYWDNDYDMANGTVAVYDISGMLLPDQKISIDKQQDYKGLLQWDCSAVPMGVYIIKITLAGETLSFPVIVAR